MISIQKKVLENGLRIVAVEMPHLHAAEIAIYIKAGGRNDPAEKTGLSHFLEHMLFKGTADFPSSMELDAAFEAIGGNANAATDSESTCYYSRVHPSHVDDGISIFSSMIRRPLLTGIELEKRIVIEEALEDLNEAGRDVNTDNLASSLLWPDHPLGLPTVGFIPTIEGFTVEDIRRHLQRFYVPNNCVVAVAGKVEAEEVFSACTRHFGDWEGTMEEPFVAAAHRQLRPRTLFVPDSNSQVELQLAFRGAAAGDAILPRHRLLRRLLAGGGSSRLHLALREGLGIVYAVDAGVSAYRETGVFAVELATGPENLPAAVDGILKELLRLVTEPVPAAELQRVKRTYCYDIEYTRDSTYDMQVRHGWGELMGVVKEVEEDLAEVERVTAEDLAEAAASLFAPKNLNLVAVGPVKRETKREVAALVAEWKKSFRDAAKRYPAKSFR